MAETRGTKRSRSSSSKVATEDGAKERTRKPHKRPDDEQMATYCRLASAEWKDAEGRRDTILSFTGKMLSVTVGEGEGAVKYSVHEEIFTKASKAFENAAISPQARFGDTSPAIFEAVLHWVYTDSIEMPTAEKNEGEEGKDEEVPDIYAFLIELYAVATTLAMPGLKNDVLDQVMLEACASHTVPMAHLKDVYAKTTKGSSLRKLMLDLAAYEVEASQYAEFKLPAEIWKDIAMVLRACVSKDAVAPFERGLKAYYERI